MNCPRCQVTLNITVRESVEIDYCPQCRGVWLDRGELDKIIERSSGETPRPESRPAPATPPPAHEDSRPRRDYDDYDDDRYDKDYRGDRHRRKKRGGFLSELFDFD